MDLWPKVASIIAMAIILLLGLSLVFQRIELLIAAYLLALAVVFLALCFFFYDLGKDDE